MSQLHRALVALEPRLRRHRPLARACPGLLLDLAAVLSGLRTTLMLDSTPGATPAQLADALQPLQQLLPSFRGCLLHLDGCCYVADAEQLLQLLAALSAQTPGSWPLIVGCGGPGPPREVPPAQCGELAGQLAALEAAVRGALAGAQQQEQRQQQQAGGSLAIIDLGQHSGLPAMPTLNGLLLRYPLVYWVRDAPEAAAAGRALSACRLTRYQLCARAAPGLLPGGPRCAGAAAGGAPAAAVVIMGFTAPQGACDDARLARGVEAARAALAQRLAAAATGDWERAPLLSAEPVAAGVAVSL